MTKKLHWNTEEPQFQKTHQKDKTRKALTIENQTMHKKSPKQIQLNLTLLLILQDWL